MEDERILLLLGMGAFLVCALAVQGCGGIGPLRGPKPFVTFYVVVRDLNATLKKATDGGGKIVFPATKVGPTTTIALFSDLDGNVIGLTDGK